MRKFWAFDVSVTPPLYCEQSLSFVGDAMEHVIDGQLRAIVPRSHVVDYIEQPGVAQALSPTDVQAVHEFSAGL